MVWVGTAAALACGSQGAQLGIHGQVQEDIVHPAPRVAADRNYLI